MNTTFSEQKFEEVKTIDDFKKLIIEILQEVFNEINENEERIDNNDDRIKSNVCRIEDLECK